MPTTHHPPSSVAKATSVSPAKAVEGSRHRVITDSWKTTYQEASGEEGTFDREDARALKKFLEGWSGTAEHFLQTAREAINAGRQNAYLKSCRNAGTIRGLCRNWTAVRAELSAQSPSLFTSQKQPTPVPGVNRWEKDHLGPNER